MTDQSRLTWALILSVLLHGLLLTVLPLVRHARIDIPTPSLVDVDLVPLPKARPAPPPGAAPPAAAPVPQAPAPQPPVIPVPKQQIVSPSEQGEEKEPANTRLLSDRNNTVKQETVHRGEPPPGNPDTQSQAPQHQAPNARSERQELARKGPSQPAEHHTQVAALPKLDQLLPQPGDLIREGLVKPEPEAAAPAPQQQASTQRQDLLRHGDPWSRGSVRGGSLDFLPDVREGDVTLLNTKAEQFAPFVRRVAMRVFQDFSIAMRRSVTNSFRGAAQESAVVEAIMDKHGQLLRIEVKDRSARTELGTDRILQSACREGFFDRNPPPGAEANDGNIHVLFETQVAISVDPGRGRPAGGWLMAAGLL